MTEDNTIRIQGARQHNLKNIDLELPRDRLIVFTGVSGSGKSSLAFDTIFAEDQRCYVGDRSSRLSRLHIKLHFIAIPVLCSHFYFSNSGNG
ncbi:MAG: hypothetical protein J7545_01985 [Roseofilum sp. SBFL]|nr:MULTISPECIES: hypothetical protein [unclassified Roseofilum]MBP0014338.1 hypothetical protein [Roseofilum sp. SID3]MBP0040733.1 hypothetical protein [Roseofilum sp. SBFL]